MELREVRTSVSAEDEDMMGGCELARRGYELLLLLLQMLWGKCNNRASGRVI